jgi:hypothetical protein
VAKELKLSMLAIESRSDRTVGGAVLITMELAQARLTVLSSMNDG